MSFPEPSPKQARILWFSITALAIAALCGILGLLLWGLGLVLHELSAVLMPVMAALVLAYILDPVVAFFERHRFSRKTSVFLVFILAVLIVVSSLASVLPGILDESRRLAENMPKDIATLRLRMDQLGEKIPLLKRLPTEFHFGERAIPVPVTNALIVTLSTNLAVVPLQTTNKSEAVVTNALAPAPSADDQPTMGESLMPNLKNAAMLAAKWLTLKLSAITTWMEFLIGFMLVPVYLFYFLLEKQSISERWTDYLPLKNSAAKEEAVFVLKAVNDCLIVFFRGQVLVALCVGALLTIGYFILGLNYAVLLGLVAAVLGIVPYLGTLTSLVLALMVAGVQFGDWTHPLLVLGIVAVVKLLEDFVISPRIIGERAGLPPVVIIFAVMVGTTLLGGFIGAMLAIPLTATLRTLMFRYIWIKDHSGETPEAKAADKS